MRWTSYDQKRDCYQGVIEGKAEIARQFLSQRKLEPGYDYSGLEAIVTMLIGERVSITEVQAKATLEGEPELASIFRLRTKSEADLV